MSKTIACIIARTVSTRLPLKVLRLVDGKNSMLDFMIQRLTRVKGIDAVYLCTSTEPVDDILEDVAEKNGVNLYRGSPDAVIERIISVGDIEGAENVIRITGDNVFTATEYLEEQIHIHTIEGLDYTRIINLPIGATAEVMKLTAVKDCYNNIDPAVSEYLLLYMFNPDKYKCGVLKLETSRDLSRYTLTVDTPEDLLRTKNILKSVINTLGCKLLDIIEIVDSNNILNSKIAGSSSVKLPYGKIISFEEFQDDMACRIDKSNCYEIGAKR